MGERNEQMRVFWRRLVLVAVPLAAAAAALVTRRPVGRLAAAVRGREVSADLMVGEPVTAVYRYCRDGCVLADLVTEIRRIDRVSDRLVRVHLVAPSGHPLIIPVERTADHDNRLVAWKAGGRHGLCGVQLRLRPGPGRHTTLMHARLWWRPGHGLAQHFRGDPRTRLDEAVHRLECALADRLADGDVVPPARRPSTRPRPETQPTS
ncbi:hypothetical protein GCM10012275_04860 [Longimycelium tulufanense]|uniref:SRPBCC family protein n=1 Tax=Longimycelium tulufanense TaxID=907463 RepID=A0A8J3CA13_9PSEU|nr:hypothetical protein [Longimycelium tulufanense]GGM36715.1 hypothetical protein GCM10012275_04860 [Longimycelium tulufanense]